MLSLALLTTLLFSGNLITTAQQTDKYNVAIFLYEGAELLDFAGPGEVFGATSGFNVYTVSVDGKPILSQRFVTINPQYSIVTAPKADVLVFPGGNSTPSSKNEAVLTWIKSNAAAGAQLLSVCTGAEILARAGLLENMNVTTYYGFIPGLQAMLPNSTVLKETRYVDNGKIVTTAGVSAGIDGALHLLSRIKGLDVAKATAQYMEYDKWKAEEGRIDYHNPHIEKIKASLNSPEKEITASLNMDPGSIPYEGELKNLAFSFRDNVELKKAIKVLEFAKKFYPGSVSITRELNMLNRKVGNPAPTDEQELLSMIKELKTEAAFKIIEKDRKNFPGSEPNIESAINMEGYHFMMKKDYASAIKVLELNVKLYPQSWNAFASLGEAYLKAGDKKSAIVNYKKSLSLNQKNENARKVLSDLGE